MASDRRLPSPSDPRFPHQLSWGTCSLLFTPTLRTGLRHHVPGPDGDGSPYSSAFTGTAQHKVSSLQFLHLLSTALTPSIGSSAIGDNINYSSPSPQPPSMRLPVDTKTYVSTSEQKKTQVMCMNGNLMRNVYHTQASRGERRRRRTEAHLME